jgi:hypothetical protein
MCISRSHADQCSNHLLQGEGTTAATIICLTTVKMPSIALRLGSEEQLKAEFVADSVERGLFEV